MKTAQIEKIVTTVATAYFFIGLFFGFFYALFYHWEVLSFFSPGFYTVVLSWPVQAPGLFNDLRYFGFSGKTLY